MFMVLFMYSKGTYSRMENTHFQKKFCFQMVIFTSQFVHLSLQL